jgi:hypothetical protein
VFRVTRNAIRSLQGQADFKRWSSSTGLEPWWDARTELLARLVPGGSRVIEFGAGRRTLERLLPPGCSYVASDLTDRGPNTIVCDLNVRPLPNLANVSPTVAVFGGVFEYVKDVQGVIEWLAQSGVETFVLSFDAFPDNLGWYRALRERARRLYFGYMNNLAEGELVHILDRAGFSCAERQIWTIQRLFRFTKK